MLENDMIGDTKGLIREVDDKATNKLNDLGRSAADAVDTRRRTVADGLASTAEKLHRKADHLPGVDKIAELTHGAANRMEGAADYLRDHDTSAMVDEVKQFVRKHPGKSLALAAVAGFLTARAFRDE